MVGKVLAGFKGKIPKTVDGVLILQGVGIRTANAVLGCV